MVPPRRTVSGEGLVGQKGDECRLVLADVDVRIQVARPTARSAMTVDRRSDQVTFAIVEFDAGIDTMGS